MNKDAREDRITYAKSLDEFEDQRRWYSARSSQFKTRSQRLDLLILGCGALVAAIPVLKPDGPAHWTDFAIAILGVSIAFGQGAQRVFRFSDIWPEYRLASERMKREFRLFINGAGIYKNSNPDDHIKYVEQLEQIIAEEQKIFFDDHRVDVANQSDG